MGLRGVEIWLGKRGVNILACSVGLLLVEIIRVRPQAVVY